MMSEFFEIEAVDILRQFRANEVSIHTVYQWWDCCLVDEMPSKEGNSFAMHYFDFERGQYIHDYIVSVRSENEVGR